MSMTKREHDEQTKWNYGTYMAGDTRAGYRQRRYLPAYWQRDRLKERAVWRHYHPSEPVLGLGSPLRAPTEWRLRGRLSRLPYTREELAALAR